MDAIALLKHEIIQDLKRVASEIGHVPSRDEWVARHYGAFSAEKIKNTFGTWTSALAAAGLRVERKKERLPDIFLKPISEVISQKDPIPKRIREEFASTLFIGDTHFPFVDQDALCALYEFADRKKPKRIVQLGDLHDMFSQSKFPRSRNSYNPFEEASLAFEMASKMWKTLLAIVPQAECHQLLGNHDVRPLKRILEQAPDAEVFLQEGFQKYYSFEGVQTHFDARDELNLGRCSALHGYLSHLGMHMEYMRRSVWCGHSHRGGVLYKNYGDKILYEANAGFLGDVRSKALSYLPQKHSHSTLGFGWDDEDGPRFIAL